MEGVLDPGGALAHLGKVKSGSKTLRVVENKRLDNAECEAKDSAGQLGGGKTSGGQTGERSSSMFIIRS